MTPRAWTNTDPGAKNNLGRDLCLNNILNKMQQKHHFVQYWLKLLVIDKKNCNNGHFFK